MNASHLFCCMLIPLLSNSSNDIHDIEDLCQMEHTRPFVAKSSEQAKALGNWAKTSQPNGEVWIYIKKQNHLT